MTGHKSKIVYVGGVVLAVSLLSNAAVGQEVVVPGVKFELGGGGILAPTYEGSRTYQVSAFPIVRFGYLALENGFTLGGGDGQGLSVRPSVRYLVAREAADNPELTGLSDAEAALELGGGLKYASGPYAVFADVRYGATGHKGFVGEFGADYVFRPEENTTLTVGPRVRWASGKYMNTYFSVSAPEAAASGLSVFNAGAGLKSVGMEAVVRHDFNKDWAVEAGVGYDRLTGDAANSPIVSAGSEDQFSGMIGIVRKFQIGF
ncbi:MAG: MipA/OmpV family protein [Hoeflea sp.]|uniref:MipA/OmpV family protein n=1 Tax=Hoeflea sp. TaxID=1940281 RepID=UPI003EF732F6